MTEALLLFLVRSSNAQSVCAMGSCAHSDIILLQGSQNAELIPESGGALLEFAVQFRALGPGSMV